MRLLRCCDLLSECIFDLLLSNGERLHYKVNHVVICFQNVSLIYCYPTKYFIGRCYVTVVICFQNVSLIYCYPTKGYCTNSTRLL